MKIFPLLVFILSVLGPKAVYTEEPYEYPRETLILSFPDHSEATWKELSRYVGKSQGLVEVIPIDQAKENWAQLISFMFNNHVKVGKFSIDEILESFHKETLSSYSTNDISWKIIEKHTKDCIYEWHERKSSDGLPQHEIARIFLTKEGLHRVGFTMRKEKMSPEVREKWIQLLKKNCSVISFQEGTRLKGLSLVEKLKDSLELGEHFKNWNVNINIPDGSGFHQRGYTPPAAPGSIITEYLEIRTVPAVAVSCVVPLFESQKEQAQERTPHKINFEVLEESPSEIIYRYAFPVDPYLINVITRTFITDYGYYSITYRQGLKELMPNEDILKCKENLKAIRVKVPNGMSKTSSSNQKTRNFSQKKI